MWIAELVEHGLVRPSFVPPKPLRELRNLTRYRRAQVQERTRETHRLNKNPPGCGDQVVERGQRRARRVGPGALIDGRSTPAAMADLAKGRMRTRLPALTKALRGGFTAHHALLVGEIMAKLEFLDEAIGRLSAEIDRVMLPYARQRDLLDTIPGVNKRSAEELIADRGGTWPRWRDPRHGSPRWAGPVARATMNRPASPGRVRPARDRRGCTAPSPRQAAAPSGPTPAPATSHRRRGPQHPPGAPGTGRRCQSHSPRTEDRLSLNVPCCQGRSRFSRHRLATNTWDTVTPSRRR